MIFFPPCKINLGLQILSRRPDGYHDIETCFYLLPLTDILEVVPSTTFQFTQSGIPVPGEADNNLIVRAFQLMQEKFKIGEVAIHLHKMIPMGAGLGGGSSDGACTLLALRQLFELNVTDDELCALAAQLGSDCAFFIRQSPQLGRGRGEILSPMTAVLKNYFLVLVKPDVHVSTSEAYAGISIQPPATNVQSILCKPVEQWRNHLVNDFEKTIFKKHPIIQGIKEKLYDCGALYASMSGSGASVFGIFDHPVELRNFFPGFFYWAGELN